MPKLYPFDFKVGSCKKISVSCVEICCIHKLYVLVTWWSQKVQGITPDDITLLTEPLPSPNPKMRNSRLARVRLVSRTLGDFSWATRPVGFVRSPTKNRLVYFIYLISTDNCTDILKKFCPPVKNPNSETRDFYRGEGNDGKYEED